MNKQFKAFIHKFEKKIAKNNNEMVYYIEPV